MKVNANTITGTKVLAVRPKDRCTSTDERDSRHLSACRLPSDAEMCGRRAFFWPASLLSPLAATTLKHATCTTATSLLTAPAPARHIASRCMRCHGERQHISRQSNICVDMLPRSRTTSSFSSRQSRYQPNQTTRSQH